MSRNRLAEETSPYLLQHKDNPVHWRAWGPAAFEEARRGNKPLLLSVGYAACHWCHVMAHESFENAETAALMNELFVNVKVDREERPDVDTIYQQALALLGEHGGWPLTMFLNPDGEPFWGGTYFPGEPRYGRPGFKDVLRRVAEVYATQPDAVQGNAQALKNGLAQLSAPQPGDAVSLQVLDRVADFLAQKIDLDHGGFGPAPKFPQIPAMKLLWRAYRRSANALCRQAVLVSLDRMCQGGIYDHLGGGFARYSTDARWLAPHFEKMLYDNALFVDLLIWAWQDTRDPLYAARVAETLEWVLREMRGPEGGFAASLDADSEGEEGRFYVWTAAEIDVVLGKEAGAFKEAYDVTPDGNWEGHAILNRTARPDLGTPEQEARLARARDRLFRRREDRVRPGRDDKVLLDWNGLMLAAFAEAGAVFARPDWLAAAADGFRFVAERMVADGRLGHSYRDGRLKHAATLDGYANMIRAALVLFEATGEAAYLERARDWAADVDAHYLDGENGGYFFTADDVADLIARPKNATDNATPSGNGTMAENLARLYFLTGETAYRARAEATIAAFSGELSGNLFPLTTLLNAAETLERCVQVVIAGDPEAAATQALRRAAFEQPVPNRLVRMVAPGAALPESHPAHGKGPVDGSPAAYVCAGPTCSLPMVDPGGLAAALAPDRAETAPAPAGQDPKAAE